MTFGPGAPLPQPGPGGSCIIHVCLAAETLHSLLVSVGALAVGVGVDVGVGVGVVIVVVHTGVS